MGNWSPLWKKMVSKKYLKLIIKLFGRQNLYFIRLPVKSRGVHARNNTGNERILKTLQLFLAAKQALFFLPNNFYCRLNRIIFSAAENRNYTTIEFFLESFPPKQSRIAHFGE